MATTKIFTVRKRLDHLLRYICDTDKTENPNFGKAYSMEDNSAEQPLFVSGINCSSETAYESMKAAFRMNDKPLRVQGYHVIQSFAPGEVDATVAHMIGKKTAERLWGDHYQVLIATHLNTGALHNHIAICSTSFIDGRRYHSCKASYRKIREVSDMLCREHQLSVIEKPSQKKYKSFAEHQAQSIGRPTWRTLIKEDVDEAIAHAISMQAFFKNLENLGYAVKLGKDFSVRPPGKERFVRLERNFGENYSPESIKERILEQSMLVLPIPKPRAADPRPVKMKPAPKGSFLALYRHYLYLFGYYKRPPTPAQNRRMHYLLREDLRKLDEIVEDYNFLKKNGIETLEQLDNRQSLVAAEVNRLTKERQPLYRISRISESEEMVDDAGRKISAINNTLKDLRKQIRQCNRIRNRSVEIDSKIARIDKESDLIVSADIAKKSKKRSRSDQRMR